jgi:hypothetical protein
MGVPRLFVVDWVVRGGNRGVEFDREAEIGPLLFGERHATPLPISDVVGSRAWVHGGSSLGLLPLGKRVFTQTSIPEVVGELLQDPDGLRNGATFAVAVEDDVDARAHTAEKGQLGFSGVHV